MFRFVELRRYLKKINRGVKILQQVEAFLKWASELKIKLQKKEIWGSC